MKPICVRVLRLLTLAALLGVLLGTATTVAAQTPPRGPRAAVANDLPVGMVRVTGAPGGALTFPIFGVHAGVEYAVAAVGGGGGGAGRATFDAVAVIKAIDAATPWLWQITASGQHLPRVDIALCRSGQDCAFGVGAMGAPSANAYLVYSLEDVLIIALTDGGEAAGGSLTEQVAFTFEKLRIQAGTGPAVCWSMRDNRVATCP